MRSVPLFESHVTIEVPTPEVLEELKVTCYNKRIKLSIIELPTGEHPVQVMASVQDSGEYKNIESMTQILINTLKKSNFNITRVKIEGELNSIPEDFKVPVVYYEGHIKLLLSNDFDSDRLNELVVGRFGRLSKNARRVREDNLQERFITMRHHGNVNVFEERFDSMVSFLKNKWFIILELEKEIVFLDTKETLDRGWF